MKRLILVLIGVGVLAGLGFYVNRPKSQAAPTQETAVESEPPAPPQVENVQQPAVTRTEAAPSLAPVANTSKPGVPSTVTSAKSAIDASLVARAVDTIVSPQSSHQQRRDVWKQLREAGKLDQAIADLEQRVATDPRSAECAAALGQAYLQKCGTIKDVREQGILAMQADKVFDTALSLDTANWEARFTKAVGMSYWPAQLNKGMEVIEQFHALIQDQETQTPEPQFARSYAWLGDQYKKAGQPDYAIQVWQRGAAMTITMPRRDALSNITGDLPMPLWSQRSWRRRPTTRACHRRPIERSPSAGILRHETSRIAEGGAQSRNRDTGYRTAHPEIRPFRGDL
jgi:hypothetical protein